MLIGQSPRKQKLSGVCDDFFLEHKGLLKPKGLTAAAKVPLQKLFLLGNGMRELSGTLCRARRARMPPADSGLASAARRRSGLPPGSRVVS